MCFFSYNTETQGILPAKAGINAVLVILSFTTENTSQSDYITAARSQNNWDGETIATVGSLCIPYPIQSIQCLQNKFLFMFLLYIYIPIQSCMLLPLDKSYRAWREQTGTTNNLSMSHCKMHKSFPLLGRLKTVLQLLELSLNDNDPLLHLAPGSLVHHRHVSTTVRAKRLVVMVASWMVLVLKKKWHVGTHSVNASFSKPLRFICLQRTNNFSLDNEQFGPFLCHLLTYHHLVSKLIMIIKSGWWLPILKTC